MSETKNDSNNNNFSTFVTGIVFGAVLTYLFTTESGKKIKTELLKEGSKLLESIGDEVENVKAQVEEKKQEVQKKVAEKAEGVKENISQVVDKVEEVLREAPPQVEKLQKQGRHFFFSKKSPSKTES